MLAYNCISKIISHFKEPEQAPKIPFGFLAIRATQLKGVDKTHDRLAYWLGVQYAVKLTEVISVCIVCTQII